VSQIDIAKVSFNKLPTVLDRPILIFVSESIVVCLALYLTQVFMLVFRFARSEERPETHITFYGRIYIMFLGLCSSLLVRDHAGQA